MSKKLSRRKFVKLTSVAAAGMTTGFLFPQRALAQQKTLKIIQWGHFVPGYDKWFDNTFSKEWGAKNNTNVVSSSFTRFRPKPRSSVANSPAHRCNQLLTSRPRAAGSALYRSSPSCNHSPSQGMPRMASGSRCGPCERNLVRSL